MGSSMKKTTSRRVGLIGARGHTGAELIRLVADHPRLDLLYVSSRELAGQFVADQVPGFAEGLRYEDLDPATAAARGADAVFLALPNGHAARWVAAIDACAPRSIIVDLSADHRFNDAWHYGLPELTRIHGTGQTRIANPGCYATAMQLILAPWRDRLDGLPVCFGVSGYSGAGTTPSDRNNPELLRDNLMPYQLAGHMHEREVSHRLRHAVAFLPHVASHFRGITLTAHLPLRDRFPDSASIAAEYRSAYAGEPLVKVLDDAPWVSHIAGRHHVEIGGCTLGGDGRRAVVVATLDNLLKGAATQAIQNLNLALGHPELEGIPHG